MEVEGEERRNTNVPSLGSTQTPSTGLRHPSFLWWKVPESDARSVVQQQTPSTGLRHPSFLWRKVPESGARSVGST